MSHKPIVVLLLCFFSTSFLFGQKKVHHIEVVSNTYLFVTQFRCDSLIDNRWNKENIGYVRKGADYRKVEAHFEGDFNETLKNKLNSGILSPIKDAVPLCFIIHQFDISERLTFGSKKKGIARVEIEFAKMVDSKLYSLGRFKSEIISEGMLVTNKHKNKLNQCLNECIDSFKLSHWETKKGDLIDLDDDTAPEYDYTQYPEEGVYTSYEDLVRDSPKEKFQFSLNPMDGFSKLSRYEYAAIELEDKNKLIEYISDGENIYFHASLYSQGNYFVKAMHYGRYIYLEDRLSDTGATIAFGLVGALASSKRVSIIYDPLKNKIFFLNNKTLHTLIKEYPDIFKNYIKSDRKREDRLEALLALNAKFEK